MLSGYRGRFGRSSCQQCPEEKENMGGYQSIPVVFRNDAILVMTFSFSRTKLLMHWCVSNKLAISLELHQESFQLQSKSDKKQTEKSSHIKM